MWRVSNTSHTRHGVADDWQLLVPVSASGGVLANFADML
jgi:hypothetical protein